MMAEVEGAIDVVENEDDDTDAGVRVPRHLEQLAVVASATASCSRNIGFSGFTIAAVFGALAAAANDSLIRMPAVACMVAAIGTCAVALLVVPPLLFVCFEPLSAPLPSWWCQRDDSATAADKEARRAQTNVGVINEDAHSPSEASLDTRADVAAPLLDDGMMPRPLQRGDAAEEPPRRWRRWAARVDAWEPWRAMAAFAARYPWPVVLAFLVTAAPFGFVCAKYFVFGFSLYAEIPIGTEMTARLQGIAGTFTPQVENSFYLLFEYPTISAKQRLGPEVSGEAFIRLVTAVIAASMDELGRSCPSMPAVATHPFAIMNASSNGTAVPPARIVAGSLLQADEWFVNGTGGYSRIASLTISPAKLLPSAGWAVAAPIQMLTVDPWSEAGRCICGAFHRSFEAFDGGDNDDVFAGRWVGYFGPNSASYAVSTHAYSVAPRMVLAVVGMLAACSLLFFRSVFVAARLLVTMAWTLVVSFGVTLLVFVVPATRVDDSYMAALHWFVPVLGLALVTAITLDYDGFVISRVIEERMKPDTTDADAVVRAVAVTGSVITFAGVIMCVAFGSLVLSDMLLLRQFAVVIAVSVLLDTFVVRPIFVPALIATAAGPMAWWPRVMPAANGEAAVVVGEDQTNDEVAI